MDIATGEYGLLATLKRLMFNELDAVTVVDKCVSGDTCFLLVRLGESSVDDEALAVRANRRLAFDGANRHMAVDDTSARRVQTELLEYPRAYLFIVRQTEISTFLFVPKGFVGDEIALERRHLIFVVERRERTFP